MSSANRRMRMWYADPAQWEKWGRQAVGQGLYPSERVLIDKYFQDGKKLLDIGCGGGREALILAGRFRLTAVDFSRSFCEMAARVLQAEGFAADVCQMDATALAFGNETFDHVVMVGQLIGQIPGRNRRILALTEIKRVLVPGGVALVSTNAIELGWRYRAYFALFNRLRKIHNPHGLEPDDAFVFRTGGRRCLFGPRADRPVFHWYRTKRFLEDAAAAGFVVREHLRRCQFESQQNLPDRSTSGETFYILEKPQPSESIAAPG